MFFLIFFAGRFCYFALCVIHVFRDIDLDSDLVQTIFFPTAIYKLGINDSVVVGCKGYGKCFPRNEMSVLFR